MKRIVAIGMCFLLLLGMVGCAKPPPEYTLNIEVSGQGSVTPSSGTKYKSGTLVELIPTASSGWVFDKWSGPDAASVVTNAGKYTIIMDKTKNITAVFVKLQHEVTVNVSPPGSGGVEVSLAEMGALASYEHGQPISLLATPVSGYVFDHWEGDLSGTTNPATLTVDAPKNITAVFISTISGKIVGDSSLTGIANITINYSGDSTGQVTTDANGQYSIAANGNITLTPVAPQDALFFVSNPPSKQVTGPTSDADFTISSVIYETLWGSRGSENGQFYAVRGVAVNSSGNIYVADKANHRIQIFDNTGTFLSQWTVGVYYPTALAIDSSDNVYITDQVNDNIQKFTSTGTFISEGGGSGSNSGQFDYPSGIAIDSSDNVYVADTENNRIQKFTSDGTFISQWGGPGSNNGQFDYPTTIAIDSSDNVYVVDQYNYRIQVFKSDGTFLAKWGEPGSNDGQFNYPWGIAIDNFNNVYVADTGNSRIQKFSSNGTFLAKWGELGSGNGQFNYPSGITVDGLSNIYIVDTDNYRIQKFKLIQ